MYVSNSQYTFNIYIIHENRGGFLSLKLVFNFLCYICYRAVHSLASTTSTPLTKVCPLFVRALCWIMITECLNYLW